LLFAAGIPTTNDIGLTAYTLKNALMGYDIINGDPFNDGGDSGFRNEIFQSNIKVVDGVSYFSDITVAHIQSCQMTFTTGAYSTYNQYIDAKSASLTGKSGFEIGLTGTRASGENVTGTSSIIKQLQDGKFTNSKDAQKKKTFFSSGDNLVIVSEAACMTQLVAINRAVPPPFKDTFIEHLRRLEKLFGKPAKAQEQAYYSFIENYGTHYLSQARFGGKVIVESQFFRNEFQTEQLLEEIKCRSDKYGKNISLLDITGRSDKCIQSAQKSDTKQLQLAATTVKILGSLPISLLDGRQHNFEIILLHIFVIFFFRLVRSAVQSSCNSKYGSGPNKQSFHH
jgi:hypothetical protein